MQGAARSGEMIIFKRNYKRVFFKAAFFHNGQNKEKKEISRNINRIIKKKEGIVLRRYNYCKIFVLVLALGLALLTGCSDQEKEQSAPVKFGVLPIVDNLPFWVAEEKGYFADEGVKVELVPFDSAMERDSAISAKQVDGALGDILALAAMNGGGVPAKAVALGQGVTPVEGRFALLSAPGSGITKPEQLKGVEVAVSLNSIIEYVTDKLLLDQGFSQDEIKKTAIPKIPARVEALLSGQVQAAVLPDPPAAIAELKGANLVLDDTSRNISQTIIYFREDTLENKMEEVKGLMRAYTRAVEDIQAQPGAFDDILTEKARVPQEVLDQPDKTGMQVVFSLPELPAKEDIAEVVDWMLEHELLDKELTYTDLVNEEVLQ